jgi:hypothetical protein
MTLTYRKVGGLHFVRFARLSVSFCLCKGPARPKATRQDCKPIMPARRAMRSVRLANGQRAIVSA